MRKSVVVLISGSGSNLQAVIDAAGTTESYQVVGVLSNKADAYGLTRARQVGIATAVLDHKVYPDRGEFDAAMIRQIDRWGADLVVLAGFMRILTAEFVQHYAGRLLNIHPSLLPKFKGLNTHARALEAGEAEHGCTVHFVNEELDGGYPIIQAATPIRADDTPATLAQRVHTLEHQIYPVAVDWFCSGRLSETPEGAELDGKLIAAGGTRIS